mmetsp:Transcript_75757/g.209037  ORF Transcript_75757/g.209037 Transcript_75757/m.209037 type:complete len:142 (-) Transcript_75757:639-1064(-)
MLRFEPAKRTSVIDALSHPFFDGMAMHAPQLVASKPVDAATIDFEHSEIKLPQVRRKILDEIRYYTQRRITTVSQQEVDGEAGPSSSAGASSAQTARTVTPPPTSDEREGSRKRRRTNPSADATPIAADAPTPPDTTGNPS